MRRRAIERLLPIVAGLVVIPAGAAAGYHWIEGWPWLDAIYMTVITLSTVGFNEVHPLSPAGRVFTMCLIVSGGLLGAYAIAQLGQFVFSGEWRRHWEIQKRRRVMAKLSDHIIVCGYGRVGRSVVQELKSEGIPFSVIDLSQEKVGRLQEDGELAVHGDAAEERTLREAGIERARGLVTAARSDAENVFIVLTARSLRADLSIVSRADVEESEAKLLRAGATRVILPYHITGRRMVTMLVRPDAADFLDEVSHTSGMELLLEQVLVSPESALVGRTIAETWAAHNLDVTVLACKSVEGQWSTRPRGDSVVRAGSRLIALGTVDHLQKLIELARG
jgi:voltage-gated potassium channel